MAIKPKLEYRIVSLLLVLLIISLTPVGAAQYTLYYDGAGNLIKDESYSYEYDGQNQLIKIKNAQSEIISEFFYNHEGTRVKKVDHLDSGDVTTYYVNPNYVEVLDSTGTNEIIYAYHNGVLAAKNENNEKSFYHPDHLGSTEFVTNENQAVIERNEYLPFGAALTDVKSRYSFTGKEKDDTGLMYFESRYYNPELRHFTQPDTILPDVYDPQQLNRYSYVRNNPVNLVDRDGHFAGAVYSFLATLLVRAVTWANLNVLAPIVENPQLAAPTFAVNIDEYGIVGGVAMTAVEAVAGGLLFETVAHFVTRPVSRWVARKIFTPKSQTGMNVGKSIVLDTMTDSEYVFLDKNWAQGTNSPNVLDSAGYHWLKWGRGRTPAKYTQDALDLFSARKAYGQEVVDRSRPGKKLIKIKGTIVDDVGRYWNQVGTYSQDGLIYAYYEVPKK